MLLISLQDVPPHYGLSSPNRPLPGTRAIMSPAANQTGVTLQTLVVSPGTYSSASPAAAVNGKAFSAAVGQTEQLVYAVPASDPVIESTAGVFSGGLTLPVPPHVCVIQETAPSRPPPPYRPPVTRSMPITASGVAPTTLVYTQAAPVAHSISDQCPETLGSGQDERVSLDQLQSTQPQPGIVYYTLPSTQAGALSTTKPYAIVTALPNSAESRGLVAIPQTAVSHGGVHFQVQATGEQPVSAGRGQVGVVMYSQRKPQKMSAISPAGMGTVANSREVMYDSDLTRTLQSIAQKIGDAFTNCSEDLLLAAFEDAWKKFHANSRKYEALARLEKSAVKASSTQATSRLRVPGPPNAEVVNTPGISKLSLVRPANARPKPIVPKPSQATGTQAVSMLSSPSPTVPSPPQQHITYAYTPGSSHHQVIVQPVNPNDTPYTIFTVAPKPLPQKSYQTGLYIPGTPTSDASISQKTDAAANSSAAHQIVIAQPVLQPRPHPPVPKPVGVTRQAAPPQALAGPKVVQQIPRKHKQMVPVRSSRAPSKTIRSCALCGKEATYLCSGCHSEWYCGRECQVSDYNIIAACRSPYHVLG